LEVQVRDAVNPLILGSNAVYTISVSNHGPSSATMVLLRDVLPATTTYVSAESSQGSCVLSNGTVWCDLERFRWLKKLS
jgi:uncharacterized repeat protein (TIGR01451 family)